MRISGPGEVAWQSMPAPGSSLAPALVLASMRYGGLTQAMAMHFLAGALHPVTPTLPHGNVPARARGI